MKNELLITLQRLRNTVNEGNSYKRILLENASNSKINTLAMEMERKYGIGVNPRVTTDLVALQSKAIRIYKNSGETFSNSEISNLPFILYAKGTNFDFFNFLLTKHVDLSRETRLRRLLFIYFYNYADSRETTAIASKIMLHFRSKQENDFKSLFHRKMFVYKDNLFTGAHKLLMNRMYQQNGLRNTIEKIGFSGILETSRFVLHTLKDYYINGNNDNRKYQIFNELSKTNFAGYEFVLPSILDSLIILTDKNNDAEWKKYLLKVCHEKLGDPRLPLNQTRWNGTEGVSQKAQKIYLKWLANNDLTLFFKIIDETATDRMWRYRDKFWRAYLDYIVNTKVFFGVDAQRIARQVAKDELLNYGLLDYGSESNHSAFLFEIGKFAFCEWSHNGKLYIWRRDEAPVHFYDYKTNKSKMSRSICVESFIHSSANTYSWQKKVADWLAKNCGIRKSRFDWELK